MSTLQSVLDAAVGDAIPRAVLEILAQKALEQGRRLTSRERSALLEALRTGRTDIRVDGSWWDKLWRSADLKLELNEEDGKRLEEGLENLARELPRMIPDLQTSLVERLTPEFERRWKEEARRQKRSRTEFEKRLASTWGPVLDRLGMIATIARELAENHPLDEVSRSVSERQGVQTVLRRLQARACQVTEEIRVLLERGFADGAHARWRTLHEIAVVALFLRKHGPEVATRYLEHGAVQSFQAIDLYQRNAALLNLELFTDEYVGELKSYFDALVDRYGPAFKGTYGWAAHVLPKKGNVGFAQVEADVGLEHFRSYYTMAGHNVHANPKGILFRLGLGGEDILLTGPSNLGLTDPAHGAALSLTQATMALLEDGWTLDSLVGIGVLVKISDRLGEACAEVERSLRVP